MSYPVEGEIAGKHQSGFPKILGVAVVRVPEHVEGKNGRQRFTMAGVAGWEGISNPVRARSSTTSPYAQAHYGARRVDKRKLPLNN